MKYYQGYKYQLAEDEVFLTGIRPEVSISHEFFTIGATGIVVVHAGYAWDGSTGAADTRSSMAASLLHDCLCQAVQLGLLDPKWKPEADMEYFRLCVLKGMWRIRAAARLFAITVHAWDHARPKEIIEVL